MIQPNQIPKLVGKSNGHRPQYSRGCAQKHSNSKSLKSCPCVPGLIIQGLLGQGGFGQVWKAKRANFQNFTIQTSDHEQDMALKVIVRSNNKALKTEVELWRMLSNKALAFASCSGHDIPIVQMYSLHLTRDGFPAISMQLCKGGSLAQHVKNLAFVSGKQVYYLEESDAAMVVSRIAKALSFCHQNRVLHLDVKTDNVLIMSDSNSNWDSMQNKLSSCYLTDFGLSQMLPDLESTAVSKEFGEGPYMMNPGYICGTAGYMAPEVITDGFYSPAADAWSLGALLLKVLTGRLPPHCEEDPSDLICEFEDWKSGLNGAWLDEYMTYLRVEAWWNISHTARNVIRRLLSPHPGFRMTILELLHDPWILDNAPSEGLASAQHQFYHAVPANCASSATNVNVPAAGVLNAAIIPTVH